MTDEPREENTPEDEEVEAHLPPTPQPLGDKLRGDEDEDVEAHSVPIGVPLNKPPTP